MATRVCYLIDSAAAGSSHGSLQIGGSAPATATTATEWIVNKNAAPRYALMVYGNNVASWSTTALPDTAPTVDDCFRTNTGGGANDGKLTGTFTSGNWTVSVPVIAVTSGGDQDGRIRVRVWRSANANGSSATEMTNGATQLSIVTNLTTGAAQTSSGSVAVTQNLTLTDEYVFVQLAWEITGAGGANGRDVLIRVGSTSSVTTTNFAETLNKTLSTDTASVTDEVTATVAFERSSTDSVSVSDSVTGSLEKNRDTNDSISVSDSVTADLQTAGTVLSDSVSVTDSVSITYPWNLAAWWRGYGGSVPWSGTSSSSASTSGTNALSPYIPDPGKKSLLLWYRAPWDATSPWRHIGSVGQTLGGGGATQSSDLTTSGSVPSAGATVNGWAPVEFDGSTQALVSTSAAIDNYVPASGFIIGVLFRADTAATADALSYNNPSLFSNPESLAFTYASHGGVASLSAAYYDGAWETVGTVAAPTLGWHAAWLRYASGTLSIKLNGGAWTNVATGLSNRTVTANTFGWFVGKTQIATQKWFDGRILEVMAAASLTDTEIDELHSYWNDRYTLSITVGNNVPTAGVFEEPNKYGATMLLRAPFGTGGLRSEPTKGVTWNKRGMGTGVDPTVGTAVNGFTPAVFNGTTTDVYEDPPAGNYGDYATASAWYLRILCKTTSAATNASGPYDSDSSPLGESQGVHGIGIRDNGGTFQVRACHYDGTQRPTTYQNLTTGWHLIEAWFTGGTVYCSVDGAAPVSAGAGGYGSLSSAVLTGSFPRMGRTWSSGPYWGGEVLEATIKNTVPPEDEREMYRARYLKDRYDLTIGSLPSRYPVSGTTLHGYGTADFQGADYIEGETLNEYWGVSAGSGWALVNLDTLTSNDSPTAIASGQPTNTNLELNPYIVMSTFAPSTNTCDWGVYVRNSGSFVVGFRQWTNDGFNNYEYYVEASLASGLGKWVLVQWRYGSSQIQIRLNNGSWASASAAVDLTSAGSLNGKLYAGRSQGSTIEYIDGRLAEMALAKTRLSDDTFTEVYSYVQERYFTYSAGGDDTASVTDSATTELIESTGETYEVSPSDSITVTDAYTWELDRACSDTVTTSDSVGKDFSLTLAVDTVSTTDGAWWEIHRGQSDAVSVTDAFSWSQDLLRSDSVSSTDQRAIEVYRDGTETITVGDYLSCDFTLQRSDSISVADQNTWELDRGLSDSVSTTDAAAKDVEVTRSDSVSTADQLWWDLDRAAGTDAVSVSDAISKDFTLGISDSVSVTDRYVFDLYFVIADAASVADSQVWELTRGTGDTISSTDSTYWEVDRGTADTLSVSDQIRWELDRGTSDVAAVSDNTAFDYTLSRSDSVVVTEVFGYAFEPLYSDAISVADAGRWEIDRGIADTVSTTDKVAYDLTLGLVDLVSATDTTTWELTRGVSDVVSVADSTTNEFHVAKTDSISLLDSVSFEQSISRSDSLSIDDTYTWELTREKSDSVTVSDSLALEVYYTLDDALTVSDSPAIELIRSAGEDTVTVTDSTSFEHGRSASDVISVSDRTIFDLSLIYTDNVNVTDTTFPEVYNENGDTCTVDDSVLTSVEFSVVRSDSVSVSDDEKVVEVGRSGSDSLSVADNNANTIEYSRHEDAVLDITEYSSLDVGKLVADSAVVSDSGAAGLEFARFASDVLSVSDLTAFTFDRSSTDTLTTLDSIAFEHDRASTDSGSVTSQVAPELTRGITDALTAADSIAFDIVKGISDTISVSDVITKEFTLQASDSLTLDQALAVDQYKTTSDSVEVTDSSSATREYSLTVSDSITEADSVAPLVERSPIDSCAVSDASSCDAVYARTLADSGSVSDACDVELSVLGTIVIGDELSVTDSLALAVDYHTRLDDTLAVVETLEVGRDRSDLHSDTVTVTQALSFEHERVFFDQLPIADSVATSSAKSLIFSDALVVTDSAIADYGQLLTVDISDEIQATDSAFTDSGQVFAVDVSDAVQVADSISNTRTLGASHSDTLTASDSLARDLDYAIFDVIGLAQSLAFEHVRSSADDVSITSTTAAGLVFGRQLFDAAAIADSILRDSDAHRAATDTLSVDDSVRPSGEYRREGLDSLSALDATVRSVEVGRDVVDSIGALDSTLRNADFSRVRLDNVFHTESAVVGVDYYRATVDAIVGADQNAVNVAYSRINTDIVSSTDAVLRHPEFTRAAFDQIVGTDQARRSAEFTYIASDVCGQSDAFDRAVTFGRGGVDLAVVADSIVRGVDFVRAQNEQALVSDETSRSAELGRTGIDLADAPDWLSAGFDIAITRDEALSCSEAIARTAIFGRIGQDQSVVTDVGDHVGAFNYRVEDVTDFDDIMYVELLRPGAITTPRRPPAQPGGSVSSPAIVRTALEFRDYTFTVSGIGFVANLPGGWGRNGFEFSLRGIEVAHLRAASTLAHWGVAGGQVVSFMREAANLSVSALATLCAVAVEEVQSWEADQTQITYAAYVTLAVLVCKLDQRDAPEEFSLSPSERYHNIRALRITPPIPSILIAP